jgi:transposase-like protein
MVSLAQHFLLSAAANSLNLEDIVCMSTEEAYVAFQAIRFAGSEGEPVCPKCGCAAVYTYRTRKLFKCKACPHQFTLTSGTLFSSRKIPLKRILIAIAMFADPAAGKTAISLRQPLRATYKTAFVLAHKLREAMALDAEGGLLTGSVDVDGAEVGGYIKPKNVKKRRVDTRRSMYRSKKKQIVVVLKQRGGRVKVGTFKREVDAQSFVQSSVCPMAELNHDQGSGWADLRGYFKVNVINHSEAYWTPEAHTNNAESFFAQLRRLEHGTYTHIAGPYIANYAEELAWRQNNKRVDSLSKYKRLAAAATMVKESSMRGYWQRHRKRADA